MSILSSARDGKVRMSNMKKKPKEEPVAAEEKELKEPAEQQEEEPIESDAEREQNDTLVAKLDAHREKEIRRLKIDDTNLNDEFVNQAANYVSAASRFNKAEYVLGEEKLKLDRIIGEKDLEIRSSNEKTTEAFVEKSLKRDLDVLKQKRRILRAQYQADVYQTIQQGWGHKRDMLIQVGAFARVEMTSQAQINKPRGMDDDELPARTKNGRPTAL